MILGALCISGIIQFLWGFEPDASVPSFKYGCVWRGAPHTTVSVLNAVAHRYTILNQVFFGLLGRSVREASEVMRVIVQRVRASQVAIAGEVVGKIGRGLNLLVGISETDTPAELEWMARKCLELRIFPKEGSDRFDASVQDIGGALLVISQFTLYGDCRKGRRPSFDQAAAPDKAEALYEQFVALLRDSGLVVETGRFGAMMQVSIENDGPVTLILEREATEPNAL